MTLGDEAFDVHWKFYFYNNPWQLLLYLGNANVQETTGNT